MKDARDSTQDVAEDELSAAKDWSVKVLIVKAFIFLSPNSAGSVVLMHDHRGEGEAVDLDGLSTAAGAAVPPGASTHGPAAEAVLEGAEYDAGTGDAGKTPEAAVAA